MADNQIYNEEIKEDFLSTLPENTATTYRYQFYKTYGTECALRRDLYTFTTAEVEDALRNANRSTFKSILLTFNAIKSYVRWATSNGYASSNISILDTIKADDLMSYVDQNRKLFISEEEFFDMKQDMVNFQDIVCMQLVYEGAFGNQMSELTNLHYYDIGWNTNILQLKDDKHGKRELKVSDECLRIIDSAYHEEEYQSLNGTARALKLIPSDYILKNSITGSQKNHYGVERHLIYRRMTTIKEVFEYPYITPKSIQKSGMIKMAKDLYLRDGELGNEQLSEVAEHFGIRPKVVSGQKKFQFWDLKQFINRDNILDLYDIDIEK